MKDECDNEIMAEFVGLCAKMYAIRVGEKVTKRAKGLRTYVANKRLTFNDYMKCTPSHLTNTFFAFLRRIFSTE